MNKGMAMEIEALTYIMAMVMYLSRNR